MFSEMTAMLKGSFLVCMYKYLPTIFLQRPTPYRNIPAIIFEKKAFLSPNRVWFEGL